ncbi:TMEM165/GDT1 family protein [Cyanobium sp. NIES-981]|uniref:TMEM165/GDT1 family protein n=1 Tax=Cyanobium sp. NIES-981 TaxID=1851505 RepID=UPI0007DD3277|nr:TMEM165/GDT1 family protein [Cyanobium sp. NIES-981]SBO41947.1 Transmembrane protein [Cyanobium sp. NIES-981]
MDLALLASTFATVFLAELGDKTQLAIVTISGTSSRPGAVFAGSSAALVLASLLGAAAGGSLSSVVPTDTLQLAASVGFLVLGLRLLLMARADEDSAAADQESGAGQDSHP